MSLLDFDKDLREQNKVMLLAGVDEAGRGPLAGPVYAAAVILPLDCDMERLNDSKKLTEKTREALYDEIIEKAVSYSVIYIDESEIDNINILQATLKAMKVAINSLEISPELVVVDGNAIPKTEIASQAIVKGDTKSASIAAASILAKVARDKHMLELDKIYPEYEFKRHKGYPTKIHYQKLDEYGACSAHRESFLKKWRAKNGQ